MEIKTRIIKCVEEVPPEVMVEKAKQLITLKQEDVVRMLA
jgi:hypothetical protein